MAWQRKDGRLAGRRAEISIDLRFRKEAPVADLAMLHCVAVWCRESSTRERFIPVSEQGALLEIERELKSTAHRLSNGWAVYVMRIVSTGQIHYYFYARDAGALEGLAAQLVRAFPAYRIEQECREDSGWTEYLNRL